MAASKIDIVRHESDIFNRRFLSIAITQSNYLSAKIRQASSVWRLTKHRLSFIISIMNVRRNRGFTIVELLIVIVVIGILAAIVVVAYTNITARAKQAKADSAIAEYVKIIQVYNAANGTVPDTVTPPLSNPIYACLGQPSDYPATPTNPAGSCYQGGAIVYADYRQSIMDEFGTIASQFPSVDALVDTEFGMRGLIYAAGDFENGHGREVGLIYFVKPGTKCYTGATTVPNGPVDMCTIMFEGM